MDEENFKKIKVLLEINPHMSVVMTKHKFKLIVLADYMKVPKDWFKSETEVINEFNVKSYLSVKQTDKYWTIQFNKEHVSQIESEAIKLVQEEPQPVQDKPKKQTLSKKKTSKKAKK